MWFGKYLFKIVLPALHTHRIVDTSTSFLPYVPQVINLRLVALDYLAASAVVLSSEINTYTLQYPLYPRSLWVEKQTGLSAQKPLQSSISEGILWR